MKQKLLALILIIALCLPMAVACDINLNVNNVTGDSTNESGTDGKDAVGEGVNKADGNTGDENAPHGGTLNGSQSGTEEMSLVLASRVYSFFNPEYSLISMDMGENKLPIRLNLHSYDMAAEYPHVGFCYFVYGTDGKMISVVLERDSLIGEQVFENGKERTLKINAYDGKGRATGAEASDGVTLSFSYDDNAGTWTMSFKRASYPGVYAVTFDSVGRCVEMEQFGTVYKTEYENNKGTVSGETAGAGGVVELNYDDNGRLNKMEVYESGEVSLRIEYTFDGKGLCTKCTMTDTVNETSSASVYEYNDNGYPTKMSGTYFDSEENKDIKGPDKVIEYDANGRVVRVLYTDYDLDGSYAHGEEALYEYNEAGRLVKLTMIAYEDIDEKYHEEIREYAEDGSYTSTDTEYKDGKIARKSVNKHDAKGNHISGTVSEYDENGNVTSTDEYDASTDEYDPDKGTTTAPETSIDKEFDDFQAEFAPPTDAGLNAEDKNDSTSNADKRKLEMLIIDAENRRADEYSPTSFRKMTVILKEAKEVFNDENAAQDAIDNATQQLNMAIAELRPINQSNDDAGVSDGSNGSVATQAPSNTFIPMLPDEIMPPEDSIATDDPAATEAPSESDSLANVDTPKVTEKVLTSMEQITG